MDKVIQFTSIVDGSRPYSALECLRVAYYIDSDFRYIPTDEGFFEILFSDGTSIVIAEGNEA
jgi:hypothetical protein